MSAFSWTGWTEWTGWTAGCRVVASLVLVVGIPLLGLGIRELVRVALNREGRP